jgi:hypothetical protein
MPQFIFTYHEGKKPETPEEEFNKVKSRLEK